MVPETRDFGALFGSKSPFSSEGVTFKTQLRRLTRATRGGSQEVAALFLVYTCACMPGVKSLILLS